MKKFIKTLDLILATILIAYYISINTISNTRIAFSDVFLIAAIVLIIYHFVKTRFNNNKLLKYIKNVFRVMVVVGIIFFCTIQALLISFPKETQKNSDYIIVLGAGVKGTKVSLLLKGRLDAALKCINDYHNTGYIVVSGGKGRDEKIPEAEAMKRYLIAHGVQKERILVEDKSTSTEENLKFSKKLIEKHSGQSIKHSSIKIITTDFHSYRSSLLAKEIGYGKVAIYSSKTVYYLIPACYTREAFAVGKTLVFS